MGDGQTVNGHAKTIVAVSAVLSALAILAVALRFYIKIFTKDAKLRRDDWLILGGLVRSFHPGPLEWLPILCPQTCLQNIRPLRWVLLSITSSGSQSVALVSRNYGRQNTPETDYRGFPLPKSCYLMVRSCL